MQDYAVIGEVVAPRGVHGELRVVLTTDDMQQVLALQRVYLGEALARFAVKRIRLHQGQLLLQLYGIEDRNAAEVWRGAALYMARADARPLEEDEYYHHQIVGLNVVAETGESLGRVVEVLTRPANDVYVVQGEGGELLLPAIKDVIIQVDLKAGRLVVRLLEGLR